MMTENDRRAAEALKLREELNAARFNRRELNRLGLLAGGSYFGVRGLSLRQALAQTVTSPKLTPWKDEMPVPRAMGDSGHQDGYDVAKHQWCKDYYEPKHEYLLRAKASPHKFHSDLPLSDTWAYGENGFGGTMIDARYGEPILIRVQNDLPADHVGFGQPEIATHLHNFHSASESDGGPWNWTGRASTATALHHVPRRVHRPPLPRDLRRPAREPTTLFFTTTARVHQLQRLPRPGRHVPGVRRRGGRQRRG